MKIQPTIIAVILWTAAALKLFDPKPAVALWDGQELPVWMVGFLIESELLLGAMLIFGWVPRMGWAASIVLIGAFAIFSSCHAIAGYKNCNCFGPINANPWFSFILDAGILFLLIVQRRAFFERPTSSLAKVLGGVTACSLFGGAVLLLVPGANSTGPWQGLPVLKPGNFVVLNPNEWVGREFPLTDVISPRADVSTGEWILFFFHHDCPECREALPYYEQLARATGTGKTTANVLVVEVPPFDEANESVRLVDRIRLSPDREWFIQTPIEIQLQNGRVTLASHDLPSVSRCQ